MRNFIEFGYVAGVSAGAEVALDYTANQTGRAKAVLMPHKDDCIKITDKIKNTLLCDIEKIAYEYPYRQIPFAFRSYFNSDIICEIVTTDCSNGRAEYFREKKDENRLLKALCASCSLPVAYPMVEIDGKKYLDGSVADAIPFKRAFECGCDRVVVVLAKGPEELPTDYSKLRAIISKIYADYPKLTDILMNRFDRYQQQRRELSEYEKLGKVKVISPEQTYVKAFETNTDNLERAYKCGYEAAEKRLSEIEDFLKIN